MKLWPVLPIVLALACQPNLCVPVQQPEPKREVLVLPVRVEVEKQCDADREYIKALEYRLSFENCTSYY